MSSSLFESPPLAAPREPPADADGYLPLSGTAIAAVVLAALSPLIVLGWWFAAVPAVGMVLAVVALRDTARRPRAVTGGGLARGALALAATSLLAGLAYLAAVHAAELPAGYVRMHYGLLQPLPGDPPTAIPDSARSLDGREVLLKGYMYPGSRQRGIAEFLLCRDQGECCFGGQPKITDRVLVRLADPKGIEFTQRLVKIAGRFRVEPVATEELGGGVLYHIDAAFTR